MVPARVEEGVGSGSGCARPVSSFGEGVVSGIAVAGGGTAVGSGSEPVRSVGCK